MILIETVLDAGPTVEPIAPAHVARRAAAIHRVRIARRPGAGASPTGTPFRTARSRSWDPSPPRSRTASAPQSPRRRVSSSATHRRRTSRRSTTSSPRRSRDSRLPPDRDGAASHRSRASGTDPGPFEPRRPATSALHSASGPAVPGPSSRPGGNPPMSSFEPPASEASARAPRSGRSVALIGIDGAGKSTVARAVVERLPFAAAYLYMGVNLDASPGHAADDAGGVTLKRRRGHHPDMTPTARRMPGRSDRWRCSVDWSG